MTAIKTFAQLHSLHDFNCIFTDLTAEGRKLFKMLARGYSLATILQFAFAMDKSSIQGSSVSSVGSWRIQTAWRSRPNKPRVGLIKWLKVSISDQLGVT